MAVQVNLLKITQKHWGGTHPPVLYHPSLQVHFGGKAPGFPMNFTWTSMASPAGSCESVCLRSEGRRWERMAGGGGEAIYIYIPGTCLSSIFGLQPFKTKPFPIKTGVIWVLYIYIDIQKKNGITKPNKAGKWYCTSCTPKNQFLTLSEMTPISRVK